MAAQQGAVKARVEALASEETKRALRAKAEQRDGASEQQPPPQQLGPTVVLHSNRPPPLRSGGSGKTRTI